MKKILVIVESPTKAKTIGKMLGRNYKVIASKGHLRDLPKSTLGIDLDNHYEPKYIMIRGKGTLVNELRKEAKKYNAVYLATDPDREGEAISWHIAHLLNLNGQKNRVTFSEITKDAVKEAVKNPREIDLDLVDAQQARRVVDRLVGYQISPLLWQKVRNGLSAGRVQSVVLKLICEKENEIKNFVKEEYWSIKAKHKEERINFESELFAYLENKKMIQMDKINNETEAKEWKQKIDQKCFELNSVKKSKKSKKASPPFTTSTLQQEASKRLNFTTKKTMSIAQMLYEGIDIGKEGIVGLITYMRTDSTRISEHTVADAKKYILDSFGNEYSNGGIQYNLKNKNSQDAHEGIRPTSIFRTPESIKSHLTKDQFLLYDLIWRRTIASQMSSAEFESTKLIFKSGELFFKSNGIIMKFDGFSKVYSLSVQDSVLPELKEKKIIEAYNINLEQHFTKPPARYTEASLIKLLEKLGIGRPSTYSPTISTILSRKYAELTKKTFVPTELGEIVNEILSDSFKNIIDVEFTAHLEEELDEVADGNLEWKKVVDDFYHPFSIELKEAQDQIQKVEIPEEPTDEKCSKCGKPMVIKTGRYGKFMACSGFPKCTNTKSLVVDIGLPCPICGKPIVERISKRGNVFYGCSGFPNCKYVCWEKPLKKCPECQDYLFEKKTKTIHELRCNNKDCNYKEPMENMDERDKKIDSLV
ncbi:DNA topoisomerase I [Peptostreptococcaceae bacterium oral taxon 113 str. W5053]|nr:DNA topoisomerase I [Peptostreptococcaceae bacterium oral taxon 113 str. W5053]